MKSLAVVFVFSVLAVYKTAGQSSPSYQCYSCSSNFGSRYGRINYECLRNLSRVRTVRCSRGYYCLTSYTIRDGILTYIRRSCQNPRSDHNPTTGSVPTTDGCTSTHSRYGSTGSTTTCYFHCTSNRCNKHAPLSARVCPSQCPTSCDLITNQCLSSLSCVQCTSESERGCETKTAATPCPSNSFNYCAATRTTIFTLRGQPLLTTTTKSCTTFTNSYSIPNQPCRFYNSNSRRSNGNNIIKYVCSSFCTSDGCNTKIPGGTPPKALSGGISCAVCVQRGNSGRCRPSSSIPAKRCSTSQPYCKSTVSYLTAPQQSTGNIPVYQITLIQRECASSPVVAGCTRNDIPNSNLESYTCQETCNTDNCNTGWPVRPRCVQCDARNRTYSTRQFQNCLANPSTPRACRTPLHQFCTTISNNTASSPDTDRRVRRGCSITSLESRCYDVPARGGGTINHCQSSCNTSGCNGARAP